MSYLSIWIVILMSCFVSTYFTAYSAGEEEDSVYRWNDVAERVRGVRNRTWEPAGRISPFLKELKSMTMSNVAKMYLGVLDHGVDGENNKEEYLYGRFEDLRGRSEGIPEAYDWRNGSLAACIGSVVDQGKCGSCWAVSSVESFSDKRCIRISRNDSTSHTYSSTPLRVGFSALDLVACDHMCEGLVKCCRGCTGGYPKLAFEFIKKKGIVTNDCMPYNLSRSLLCPLPRCMKPLDDRIYKAKNARQILGGAPAMREEIFKDGPIVATFTVFEDFMTYHSGIYAYSGVGKRLGLHAVKVVGWGVSENGTDFWACQNSWGDTWGMNGSFRIAAGQCGFEESVFTATPCVDGEACV